MEEWFDFIVKFDNIKYYMDNYKIKPPSFYPTKFFIILMKNNTNIFFILDKMYSYLMIYNRKYNYGVSDTDSFYE